MTPACDTALNPFIGSECGERGKVVVRTGAVFTPLRVLTIVPKQRPLMGDWPIVMEQQHDTTDADDIKALRASLNNAGDDTDFEIVRREFDL